MGPREEPRRAHPADRTAAPAGSREASSNGAAALEGVRVLDLADESAVLATRILADLGADVVLVEPRSGSSTRHLAPFLDDEPGLERSFRHLYHNAGKRSATLDTATDEGAALLRRLAAGADVLVETAAPGALEARGLGYEQLRELSPGLIHVSVTPFGSRGPWCGRVANDLVAGAAGGLLWVTGEPDGPPVQGAASPSYSMASLAASSGVMVALAGRDRDPEGRGVHLEVSLQEATAMAVLQTANPNLLTWRGRVPQRPGLSGALRCADGEWVAFNPRPDRHEGFVKWLREAGIETDLTPEQMVLARRGRPSPLRSLTRQLAERQTRDEFVGHAFETDQLCLPIVDFDYMSRHPHYAENRQLREVEHGPLGRTLGFVASPVDAMAREIPLRRAPLLGEHNDAVYRELGLSEAELWGLREREVV